VSVFGFIGPSATGAAIAANSERTVNHYLEAIESASGATKETQYILLPTPGLVPFSDLRGGLVSAIVAEYKTPDGRAFAIGNDSALYEIFADGTYTLRGGLAGTGAFDLVASSTQLLIVAGAAGFVFNLSTNTLATIVSAGWPGGTSCAYIDGYFIVLEPASQKFAISAIGDALTWDALDFGASQGAAGNTVRLIADHRQLILLGTDHTEAYYNSGDADFPFARFEGSFMQQGCGAAKSVVNIDNSIFWLGADERGAGIVWRASGYTPVRISTHAVETAIQGYSTLSDATAYAFQFKGHTFYRLSFPTAGATWVYDCATNQWFEWAFWDSVNGVYKEHLGRSHMFAFGKHLVGDYSSGRIYELRADAFSDNGAAIRRLRRAPHVSAEMAWIFYKSFTLDMQVGVGLDGALPGWTPLITLQWSNDGGLTWTSDHSLSTSMGQLGAYKTRVMWRRLGRARDRVFQIICTDPVFVAYVNAYIDVAGGA
jgi:Phage stabilisation protein